MKLGHVALDGTKIKANASKHKAMSYERMEKRAAELEAEVERWLSAAAAADAEEDRAFGRDKSGAELPKWVADKKKRAEKIRAAKAELEAEAKAAAAAKAKAQAEAEERRQAEGRKKPGKPAAPPSEEPDPKAQKNFTDPESRIMKTKDGFIQGYNAQAAVDATAQVIVAHGLDAKQSDQHQLAPIADAIEANLGKKPTQLSADAGYCSDANLAAMEEREIDAYIAPGRAKHAGEGEGGGARVAAMREKIKAGGHSSPYRLRKQLPEPVFGQIKQARGFRQFLLRGVEKVAGPSLCLSGLRDTASRPDHSGRLRAGEPPFPRRRLGRQDNLDDRVAESLATVVIDCSPQIFKLTPGHRLRAATLGIGAAERAVNFAELATAEEFQQCNDALAKLAGADDPRRLVRHVDVQDVGDRDGSRVTVALALWPVFGADVVGEFLLSRRAVAMAASSADLL